MSPTVASPTRRISLSRVAALVITQIIGWGTLFYPPSVFGAALARDLGLADELVFAGVSIMLLVGAILGPAIGRWLTARGAREVLTVGSLLSTLAMLALAAAAGPWSFLAGWLLVGIAGTMALANPAFTAIVEGEGIAARRWISVLLVFSAGSASVFWPLTAWLEAHYGWRGSYLVFAGLQAFLCLPLHRAFIPARPDGGVPADPDPARARPAALLPPERAWLGFALFSIASALSAFVSWGLSVKFLDFLRAMGADAGLALALGTALGFLQIAARVFDFAFGRRYGLLSLGLAAMVAAAAGFALIMLLPATLIGLAGFVIIYGLTTGYLTVVRTTLPLALFDPRDFALWSGRLGSVISFALVFSPIAYTAMLSRLGPYVVGILSLALYLGAALAMFAVATLTRPPAEA